MKRLILILFLIANSQWIWAVEYYVSPSGNDSRAGTSPESARKSIQLLVDKLQPGDILTVLPGEYLQQATIRCSGTEEKPITIRGAHRDFCIIKSWESLLTKTFKRVPDKQFIYSTKVDDSVYNVIEIDTEKMLDPAPSLSDMDHFRASYFFDKKSKKLYIHCTDGMSPATHSMKITTKPGYIFNPVKSKHIIFKDLTFCGSYAENPRTAGWGYAFRSINCNNLIIDNCSFVYNCGGVSISRGHNNIVQNCFCFNNIASGYGELAQIMLSMETVNGKALNNTVMNGSNHGIRFYSGAKNPTAIGNIIVNDGIGLYYKATAGKRLAERNIVVDCKRINYSDLSGGRPIVDKWNTFSKLSFVYDDNKSNLIFDQKKTDPRFCAPENFDYRLQADSPFIGKGPNGMEPGAYQFKANVFFLSFEGDDSNSGLSISKAFKTLKKACSMLKPGDTLYLLPGVYSGPIKLATSGSADAPITICGQGSEPAACIVSDCDAAVDLSGMKHIKIEKLIIKSAQTGIVLNNSENITFKKIYLRDCGKAGIAITDSKNVRVSYCTATNCAEAAISLNNSSSITLDGNILTSTKSSPLIVSSVKNLFSEYNNFFSPDYPLATIDNNAIPSIAEFRKQYNCGFYSFYGDPTFNWYGSMPYLSAESPCTGADGKGGNLGAFKVQKRTYPPVIADFKINHMTPDSISASWTLPVTSSVLWRVRTGWWAGRPVLSYLKYGETPECKESIVSLGDVFNSVTLKGLKPNTLYYCQVVIPATLLAWMHDNNLPPFDVPARVKANWQGLASRIISFKTPSEVQKPLCRTIYVSPEGNDCNDGTRPERAYFSLLKAGQEVRPGDTVVLLPGVYRGTFKPQVSGTVQYPITLKAEQAGTAIIGGSNNIRPCGIFLDTCSNMVIDGLVFKDFTAKLFGNRAGMDYGQIEILRGKNVLIKNCVFDCFSQYQPCVLMKQVNNITLNNNVFAASPAQLQGRNIGNLTITGNTFFYTLIKNFALSHFQKGSKVIVKNNLFVGLSKQKVISKVGRGGFLNDIVNIQNTSKNGNIDLEFDANIWYFSPNDPYRYCGFEKTFPEDAKPQFGIRRLQEKFGIEKNSLEITSLKFKGGIPVDYMDSDSFNTGFVKPMRNKQLKLTLDLFAPLDELSINNNPIGARPAN